MGIIAKIRKIIRSLFLRALLARVTRENKRVVGLAEARSIGILYECDNVNNYRQITGLIKHLEKEGKTIYSLGFVNQNKTPEFTMAQLNSFFCYKKDIGWNLKIKNPHLQSFFSAGFDILIDTSPGDFFPLKYLAGVTSASYKAGIFNNDYLEIFDLLIREQSNGSLEDRLKQLVKYLEMINSTSNEQ
ncbi:MAG TPA: hypothetical protein VLH61_01775 [Bacteroidales bacterium]|nr:hypothetical protein [Bacteroidales bacterium]